MSFRCVLLMFLVAGCGQEQEKLVSVSGLVTINGQPMTAAKTQMVAFLPEAENKEHYPTAVIEPDGRYKLETLGRQGAPPGKYKVLVWITNDDAAKANPWGPDGKLRKVEYLIDSKYTSKETTDLLIEVSDKPADGQYDLKLKK